MEYILTKNDWDNMFSENKESSQLLLLFICDEFESKTAKFLHEDFVAVSGNYKNNDDIIFREINDQTHLQIWKEFYKFSTETNSILVFKSGKKLDILQLDWDSMIIEEVIEELIGKWKSEVSD